MCDFEIYEYYFTENVGGVSVGAHSCLGLIFISEILTVI